MSIAPEHGKLAFQKVERALVNLCSEQHAENVHSFRTATRRLQTLLEHLLPERDRNQKKLLKSLDRIRKRAGKVRDLDVQLAALRSLKVPQEPRRKTRLMHTLIEIRAKHDVRLLKLLNKDNINDIRKRLKRGRKEANLTMAVDPLGSAKQILARVERSSGPLTEDVLHRYRIAVKQARYAAEFTPKSVEATQFISQLKRLQDAIGNWHDWLTLTNTATDHMGDVSHSSLVAALHNVTGGKFRQAVAALAASPTIQASTRQVPTSSGRSISIRAKAPTAVNATESAA